MSKFAQNSKFHIRLTILCQLRDSVTPALKGSIHHANACDSINIPGYNIYFNNREYLSRRKSGGIVLLVKEELQKFVKVNDPGVLNNSIDYGNLE